MRDFADELLQAKVKATLFGGDHAPRLGRLVLLDRLGAGAMGTVYAAYDPKLDRKVAVKVLHAGDADANARFVREARALGKVAHPSVVAIHDAGEVDGAAYLVMELATGVPLRAWIASTARDWRAVIRVMRDVAAGLAAAHRAGIVHRDLKPDNILVGDDRARLVDFGLAHDRTGTDPAAGTPSYMAPEVLAGQPATAASDQFSFAVTLFEALHGDRPHAGTTRDELRVAALEAERAKQATAPAWVQAIVRRALAANPRDRFASMDAVVGELGRDRRRAKIIAGVAIGALAIGGGIGALGMRSHPAASLDCSGAARREAAWNPATAERVRVQLGDAPWSATAIGSLDAAAQRWQASFRTVCEATRIRGDQSDRLLELRMRCLDRALDRFGALVTALSAPLDPAARDPAARVEAASATAQLPRPETCERISDAAELALPDDPARRAEVLQAEAGIDRAWAAFALARYHAARDQLVVDAPALAGTPLGAEAILLAASIEARIGEPARARALLDRALVAAAAAHAPTLELTAWSRLLRHELFAGTPAHVIEWRGFALAAAARAGTGDADIDGITGEALRKAGRLGEAREHLARALASRQPMTGDARALLEMNLGSIDLATGKSVLAEAAFRRALAAAQAELGADHPTLAVYLDKLAHALAARGQIRDALALHDRSLALRRRAFGDADRAVASARFYRAETLLEANRLAEARTELETARAIRAHLFGDTSPRLGEVDAALAEVAAARGDGEAARTLRARAAALDPRLHAAAEDLLTIDEAVAIAALPADRATATALLARWRRAGPVDAALSLPVADAVLAAGDRAAATEVYTAALAALADEPSRSRERALRGIAR
ncbi:MAG: serine/threonine-protein kinase [Kofleriaceae bacterium]